MGVFGQVQIRQQSTQFAWHDVCVPFLHTLLLSRKLSKHASTLSSNSLSQQHHTSWAPASWLSSYRTLLSGSVAISDSTQFIHTSQKEFQTFQ